MLPLRLPTAGEELLLLGQTFWSRADKTAAVIALFAGQPRVEWSGGRGYSTPPTAVGCVQPRYSATVTVHLSSPFCSSLCQEYSVRTGSGGPLTSA